MLNAALKNRGIGTRSYAIYDGLLAETLAIIRAATVKPTAARALLINAFIQSLKTSGAWDSIGLLYVFAAADSQIARLNWKNPGVATAFTINSPTFTVDKGFNGNGVSSYVAIGVAPSAIPNWAQDSACMFAAELTTTASAGIVLGLTGGAGTGAGGANLTCRNSSSKAVAILNSGSTGYTTTASTPSTGSIFTSASRGDSSNISVYANGSLVETGGAASLPPSTTAVCAGRANTSYTSKPMGIVGWGGDMNAAKQAALHSAQQTYLNAIGAW